MGLRRSEFIRMLPEEFNAAATAYSRHTEMRQRAEWERTRALAYLIVQTQLTQTVKPQQLLPFPWDAAEENTDKPDLTPQQRYDRYRELVRATTQDNDNG